MKAQISRNSHRPEKNYSGVYQQQDRDDLIAYLT